MSTPSDGDSSAGVDQRTALKRCAAVAEIPVCCALPPKPLHSAAAGAVQAAANAKTSAYALFVSRRYADRNAFILPSLITLLLSMAFSASKSSGTLRQMTRMLPATLAWRTDSPEAHHIRAGGERLLAPSFPRLRRLFSSASPWQARWSPGRWMRWLHWWSDRL